MINTTPLNTLPFQVLDLLKKDKALPFTTAIDIVVLSCAMQRIIMENPMRYYSLDDMALLNLVIEEDYAKAEQVRKYYSQLLIFAKLKGTHISQFRTDLAEVLASDGCSIPDKCRGMIIKLPYFYDYDIQLKHLRENVFVNDPPTLGAPSMQKCEVLKPVCKMHRNVRSRNNHIYWFEVHGTKTAAKIEVEKTNPLLSFWDSIFEKNIPMVIEGQYKMARDQELLSYKIEKWKIVNLEVKT